MWLLIGIVVFVLILIGASTKTNCDLCKNPLKRSRYTWTLDGKKQVVCPNCNRRLEAKASKEAVARIAGGDSTKSRQAVEKQPVVALPVDPHQQLADWVGKLEAAKGPASRRALLAAALEKLPTPDAKNKLRLEASRIEVAAVLDKVDTLKTTAAKRRNLQNAIENLLADSVPDDLQAEQIKWLNQALADLDKES